MSEIDPNLPAEEEKQATEDLRRIFPLVKSWRQLYAFVILELVVLIGLFYWFSRSFA